jgi:hypothetical protein
MSSTAYDDQFIEHPTAEDMANKYQRDAAYWRAQAEAKDAEIAELVAGVRKIDALYGSVTSVRLLKELLAKYEPKPDPLVEAMVVACVRHGFHNHDTPASLTKHLRAELKKRGLEIREARHEQ